MNYSDIFTSYSLVDPPKVRKYNLDAILNTNKNNYLDFFMPTIIPQQETSSTIINDPIIQDAPVEYIPEPIAHNIEPTLPTPAVTLTAPTIKPSFGSLVSIDIEDLLRSEGITEVNGKKIRYGNKNLRSANANIGVAKSHHKERDPHTGNANARDISIVDGTDEDYTEFRRILLGNDKVREWFKQKNWGILNELTPGIIKKNRATGRHFHFGPDRSAVRTWEYWLANPSSNITKLV